MFLIKADELSIEVGERTLFENASIEILDNERIALIGENGVGKTSFIKALLGQIPIRSGQIMYGIEKEKIGYMDQDTNLDFSGTVREFAQSGHPNYVIKEKLDLLAKKLQVNPDCQETLNQYNHYLEKYLDTNGYEWELKVEQTLKQLEISEEHWDQPFSYLSGGQKTRVKLAKILIHSPKLIILDEPTNHLDIETSDWLVKWLLDFKGSVLFISHERDFIDKVATATYELTKIGTKKYSGGYSSYKELKEFEIKSQQKLYETYEQERKKLIETINQYKQWYDKANSSASVRDPYAQKKAAKQATKVKAKEKALERLEKNKVEKPDEKNSISTNFLSSELSARKLIEINNMSFSYDDNNHLFNNVHLHVFREDRIAIIGPNGSGKSTLLKIISGLLEPTNGQVLRNPQLKIGYFFQELENLNLDHTVLDEILSIPNMTQSDARTILACFLFRRDDVLKTIRNLSMGEKCRVAFVKLYFSNANLLVLDEPTNYFDITTRETIENALRDFPGAIILVAHDPYLLRKVTNKVIQVKNGTVQTFLSGFKDFEKHTRISPETQAVYNELEALKLQYTQLMTDEVVEDEERRIEEAKKIKKQINELEEQLSK